MLACIQAPKCRRGKALRILAHSCTGIPLSTEDNKGRKMTTRLDQFDCSVWCGAGTRQGIELQARRLCTLPAFDRQWQQPVYEDMSRLLGWQGRLPIVNEQGERQERPPEDLADGCPGGWARSRFALSFMPYMRRRLESGAHDTNPRIGPDTPGHILDSLRYFETHQARAEAEFNRLR